METAPNPTLRLLVIESLSGAFSLMARSLASTDLQDVLEINRRLIKLRQHGPPENLMCTIHAMVALAGRPEYAALQTVLCALVESLPPIWAADCTKSQEQAVAADLNSLAEVALELRAPDVAREVRSHIDTLVGADHGATAVSRT